jgi:membrane-associated phospholipid phosphatase
VWHVKKIIGAMLLVGMPTLGVAAPGDPDKTAGDVLQFAIPAAAFAVSAFKGDEEGEAQWARNTTASFLATQALKAAFNSTSWGERPNGGKGSFPSGHTAFAASGAAFLTERYGWQYGILAWAATGYVAYSRVDEHEHHWRDVAAGAALSYGISKLFVTPEEATHLAPIIGPKFIGLRWERSF